MKTGLLGNAEQQAKMEHEERLGDAELARSRSRSGETGIEELRRAARASSMCRESCFDGYNAEQCLKMIRACWGSGWDVLPDDLTHAERVFCAEHGRMPDFAMVRLEKDLG